MRRRWALFAMVAVIGTIIVTSSGQAPGVAEWCNSPSTFGGNGHGYMKRPCNADNSAGSLTACSVRA